ncbi:hypothetical protein KLP40_10040 [Hymenobacter sp. NST-14]|uniref:hypothetical protein n=1 Tax=Hymenobacter piscis TaxID=2839984 RepID=UPI001C00D292|nr:hypothetical protein [Hymenobacter piscis]MBT9393501.1 hypothetical protein [Hymenobacter piscis]
MVNFILLAITLICWPSISLSQNLNRPSDTMRFYATVYLSSSNYLFNFQTVPQVRSIRPWRVDIGLDLTSRIALQAGFMASRPNGESSSTGFAPGQRTDITEKDGGIELAAPVLIRYCFTKKPSEKLKFDAIGGLTFGYSNPSLTRIRLINGQVVEKIVTESKLSSSYITVGLGGRWVFSPRWEAVFDWTLSRNIAPVDDFVYTLAGTRNGITRSLGLGVRYRFGFAKKPNHEQEFTTR